MFRLMVKILGGNQTFSDKEDARGWFNKLRQMILDMNSQEWKSDQFNETSAAVEAYIQERTKQMSAQGAKILEAMERAE